MNMTLVVAFDAVKSGYRLCKAPARREKGRVCIVNWHLLALFILTETLLCLTPGPAVLLVLSQALARGPRASLWSSLGILAGNTLYFGLSASSIGALLVASYDLFFTVKWLGAAYLVWLGIGAFRGKSPAFSLQADNKARRGAFALLRHGFIVQAANPKALLFFTALLPQFVDPALAVVPQMAVLALVSVVIEFGVLFFYASLAAQATRLANQARFARLTNRIAGTFLIGAGIGLASLTRD